MRRSNELRAGMPVWILFAGRNNREAWPDGGNEIRNRGVFTTVMADLQNVRLQRRRIGFGKHLVLGRFSRVAGKKKTALAKFDAENE
jgi:hypothetical protein